VHLGRHEGVDDVGGVGLANAPGERAAFGEGSGDPGLSCQALPRGGSQEVGGFVIDIRRTAQDMLDGRGAVEEFAADACEGFEEPLWVRLGESGLNGRPVLEGDGLVVATEGDRWHYAREWRPGQPRLAGHPGDRLARLIATAAGIPSLQPHIERVSVFSFAAQIAASYRDRRVFLVGDAAHRMTPRGGTGMNTAIHDAYDLAWKLAWVLRGWARPSLLDSYEAERRPVGAHNVAMSGEPNGARRQLDETLPWDLNGRLAHRWLRRGNHTVSTLDLLGGGLTQLTGPGERGSGPASAIPNARVPVTTHTLDESTARGIGIPPGGAVLLRPDGQRLLHWPDVRDDRVDFAGDLGQLPARPHPRPAWPGG
jgi:putative polyketide hydroxylase